MNKYFLTFLALIFGTVLSAESAVTTQNGNLILDENGRIMMSEKRATEELKKLGISPRDAVSLVRFMKTDRERVAKIQELGLNGRKPPQKKKDPIPLIADPLIADPLSQRSHFFRENDLKSLALTGKQGAALAREIREKKGFTFNMRSVQPHEISAVKDFLKRYRRVTSLTIYHLHKDVLVEALKQLSREEFIFSNLKDLHVISRDDRVNVLLINLFARTMPNLQSLNLRYTYIGDKGAQAISQMRTLTSLDIMGNNIGDEGAQAISQMHTLTSLNIRDNKIGNSGAQALSKMHTLTSLDIRGNEISYSIMTQAISKMPNLRYLNGTPRGK